MNPGTNAQYDETSKSIYCDLGFKATEYDSSGKSTGEFINCEKCPSNQYVGPKIPTVWECKACPHFAMVYDEVEDLCVCGEWKQIDAENGEWTLPTDGGSAEKWTAAGDSCVLKSEKDEFD